MPFSAKAAANYFLDLADSAREELTPMKLQKLVYFAHGWHLGLTGEPLLNEEVQAWSFGPVIRSLYNEFREFGSGKIDRKAVTIKSAGINVLDDIEIVEPSFEMAEESDASASQAAQFAKDLARRVWDVYHSFTASQLSNMTHVAGSPWHRVYVRHKGEIPKYATIPEEWIKEYFAEQAKAR